MDYSEISIELLQLYEIVFIPELLISIFVFTTSVVTYDCWVDIKRMENCKFVFKVKIQYGDKCKVIFFSTHHLWSNFCRCSLGTQQKSDHCDRASLVKMQGRS